MNYQRIYSSLIEFRKANVPDGYSEKHHAVPRSLGGDNSKSNIVKLTAREHFIAHRLLAKIHGGRMWAALAYMSRGGTKSSKYYQCTSSEYDYIKQKDSEWRSVRYSGDLNPFKGKSHDEAAIKKMRKPRVNKENMYGRKIPGYVGFLIGYINTYKPLAVKVDTTVRDRIDAMFAPDDELVRLTSFFKRRAAGVRNMAKRDVRGDKNPNYGNGQAISGSKNPIWGTTRPAETRAKISEKAKRVVQCPHCSKAGSISNMKRWHFDNCKVKP